MATLTLKHGDCTEVLLTFPESSLHGVVSDPPYGLTFMGKGWDDLGPGKAQREWHIAWLSAAYRALKPGGVIKAFSGTRTFHHLAAAMAEVGFTGLRLEAWAYGSGFPKSLNVSKAIDKHPGVILHYGEIKRFLRKAIQESPKTRAQIDQECGFPACDYARTKGTSPFVNVIPSFDRWGVMKEVLGLDDTWDHRVQAADRTVVGAGKSGATAFWSQEGRMGDYDVTSPGSPESKAWDGWGTALKPAWEPVVIGRKPE